MSACSDQGGFANSHLGEFLTPHIPPLDMIGGCQKYASCYVIISFGCRKINSAGIGLVQQSIGQSFTRRPNTQRETPPCMNTSGKLLHDYFNQIKLASESLSQVKVCLFSINIFFWVLSY